MENNSPNIIQAEQSPVQKEMNDLHISQNFNELDAMDPQNSKMDRLRASLDAMKDKRQHRKLRMSSDQ